MLSENMSMLKTLVQNSIILQTEIVKLNLQDDSK